MLNTGRLSTYARDQSAEDRQFWAEIAACRYQLRAGEQLAWEVPETEGHDDFVVSLALLAEAAEQGPPPPISGLIRAPSDGEGRW